jgi:putative tricarboxylic transport membrane protein
MKAHVMKKGSLLAAAMFAAFALFVIVECMSFPPGRARVPGPALYPTAVALLMLFSAISLAVTAFRMTPKEDKVIGILSNDNKRVYISMAVLVVYVAAMYFIGFLTTSAAMLFGFIRWFGKYKPHVCALWAVCIAGIVYTVFRYVLLVPFRFGAFL